MKLENILRSAVLGFALLGAVGCYSGDVICSTPGVSVGRIKKIKPRIRMGNTPAPTIGITYLGNENLGRHCYASGVSEKNGILLTMKAGHIDIFHTRESADYAAYLAADVFERIKKKEKKFSFKLSDPSVYHVSLNYPDNWENISEKEKKIFDISVGLGEYLAFTAESWHEIITWHGYNSTVILTEFPSAFSWEDNFSNLLGIKVAGEALRSGGKYDEKVTEILGREVGKLIPIAEKEAVRISRKLKGSWYTGEMPFGDVVIKKRNFDIGLSGKLTPLVPFASGKVESFPVPSLNFLSQYGVSAEVEIEPRVSEKGEIFKILGRNRKGGKINPDNDFKKIMEKIRHDGVELYGEKVDCAE